MHENVKTWVDALRSGEYLQAQKDLRVQNGHSHGYCCLGVACDVSKLGEWDVNCYVTRSSTSLQVLSPETALWLTGDARNTHGSLDLHSDEDLLDRDDRLLEMALTFMNDRLGLTFSQIADMVTYFGFDGDPR